MHITYFFCFQSKAMVKLVAGEHSSAGPTLTMKKYNCPECHEMFKSVTSKTSDGFLEKCHVRIDEAEGYRLYFIKIHDILQIMFHNQHMNKRDVVHEVISILGKYREIYE